MPSYSRPTQRRQVTTTSLEPGHEPVLGAELGWRRGVIAGVSMPEPKSLAGSEDDVLGCVDICIILDICQQLRFRRNNGQRCLSSFVGSPGCTSDGKPNVSGSSMLSYGLRGLAHNGGCCHQSTVNGTSVYKRFARWCDHGVWERIHQHFVDDPDMEYLIIDSTVVRAHPSAAGAPQKRGASIPSPWS